MNLINTKNTFVMLAGLLLLALQTTAHADVTFVHTDHLGTPVAYSDAQGNVMGEESTTPFGESLNPPTSDDLPAFTGHVRDGATGLVYMQARYYDPVVGRFLSTDPVGFESGGVDYFNRYSYVSNNPVGRTDPTGAFIAGEMCNDVRTGVMCSNSGGDDEERPKLTVDVKLRHTTGDDNKLGHSDWKEASEQFYEDNEELYQSTGPDEEVVGVEVKVRIDGETRYMITTAVVVPAEHDITFNVSGNLNGGQIEVLSRAFADLHTHPSNGNYNESFSREDYESAADLENGRIKILRTPQGSVQFVKPNEARRAIRNSAQSHFTGRDMGFSLPAHNREGE